MIRNLSGDSMFDGDHRFLDELKKRKEDMDWFTANLMLHRVFVCNGLIGRFRHEKESDEEKATGLMAELIGMILAKTGARLFFDIVTSPCGVDIAKIDNSVRFPDEFLKAFLVSIVKEIPKVVDAVPLISKYRAEVISLCVYKSLSDAQIANSAMTPSIQQECTKLSDILFKHLFIDIDKK